MNRKTNFEPLKLEDMKPETNKKPRKYDPHHLFDIKWRKLMAFLKKGTQLGADAVGNHFEKVVENMKWATAYVAMQEAVIPVIRPYSKNPILYIKQFWIEFLEWVETKPLLNPPTPADFFAWYCDSSTIQKEKLWIQ